MKHNQRTIFKQTVLNVNHLIYIFLSDAVINIIQWHNIKERLWNYQIINLLKHTKGNLDMQIGQKLKENSCRQLAYEGLTISFQTFFVQAFKIVIDAWKFSMLLLYIVWDDWPISMISTSNEQLQQELEYTQQKPDCHSWWISKFNLTL